MTRYYYLKYKAKIFFYINYIYDLIILKRRNKNVKNLYFATIQKSGSQWLRRILDDSRVKKYTGLTLYPQHDYEYSEFKGKFPSWTFVPGLYISYQQYDLFIDKSKDYRTIYVIRDPRNVVVSWYHSMKKTHFLTPSVKKIRNKIINMDQDEALEYSIKFMNEKFSFMRGWVDLSKEDQFLRIYKLEELINNPLNGFKDLFAFLEIDIPDEELEDILSDYTKEKMRENDLKKRNDKSESHYRVETSNHKDYFKKQHYDLFYSLTGNLVTTLGYKK